MISYCREPWSNAWKCWDVLGSWLSLPGHSQTSSVLCHTVPCHAVLCHGQCQAVLCQPQPTAILV